MNCPGKPVLTEKGHRENNVWVWGKVNWIKCKRCSMYHSNRILPQDYLDGDWGVGVYTKTKVGIVLVRNGYVFMTETYHTSIGFPKGEKEPNESIEACAEREFHEESGTKVKLSDYKHKKITLNIYNVTYIFYVVQANIAIETRPMDTKEITSYGWFNARNIRNISNISNVSRIVLGLIFNHLDVFK
jgi:8-oxo-dGTP pyrophosphatase MutT (NUDIX family)